MQKKIIALAIASALTAPALAFADVTVYGQANLSVDIVKDGESTTSTTTNRLVSNQSRIGVKGSADLGSGLSAIWQMEGDVAMDTGAAGLFDRDTYLGLSSMNMGTLLAGRHDTPYKMSTRRLDVFADTTAADNRGLAGVSMMGSLGGYGSHDIRVSNLIAYISPSMGGFSVAAAGVFGGETANAVSVPPAEKKGSAYSLAGMFDQGPIYVALAYDKTKFGDAGSGDLGASGFAVADDESKAIKLGGSFAMDAFAVNAVVEKLTYTYVGFGDQTGTNFYLAGKFNLSSTDAVKLAYTKRGETTYAGTKQADDAKQYALGYDHAISPATMVYALYTKITDNTVNTYNAVCDCTVGNPDPSTLSIGLKHSF